MNPNEYNDEAYLEASNEFQGNATEMFTSLWKAGARSLDIVSEINNALAEAGVNNSFGTGPLTVTEGV